MLPKPRGDPTLPEISGTEDGALEGRCAASAALRLACSAATLSSEYSTSSRSLLSVRARSNCIRCSSSCRFAAAVTTLCAATAAALCSSRALSRRSTCKRTTESRDPEEQFSPFVGLGLGDSMSNFTGSTDGSAMRQLQSTVTPGLPSQGAGGVQDAAGTPGSRNSSACPAEESK